jgi:hypothetical protein
MTSAKAAEEFKTTKAAQACFHTWSRLAARAGPGAARVLAAARVRIGFAAGLGFQARPSFPCALLRGVASVADGGLPLLHRRAAGAATRSIGEAVLLRRAWGVCREYAREIARAARVPGEGWVLADAFDTWRGESRCRIRDIGEGAALVDASLRVRGVRLPAHGGGAAQATTCVRDQDWTRHARCAVRRAGYAQAAEAHEARARGEAGALKRKRAHEEITGMRVGLQHWGWAGPLPRGATGVAALGGPDSDSEGDSDGARRLIVILSRDPPAKRRRQIRGNTRRPSGMAAGKQANEGQARPARRGAELDVKRLTGVRTRVSTPCWLGV